MRTGERWQHLASTGTPRLSVGGAAPLVLVACAVAMVLHQATRWGWTIDDAAICYAYARNLAAGHGLVPWPGAERVEAYSDPTWIAVLAAFQAVGLDGFTVAKPLGMLFGLPTLWLVWRLAARAMPDHRGPGALLAPIALALNAQFAIWSASGLENGLFDLLLTAAIYRTGLDRPGGIPWAAALYLLVAWTRPEGVVYAGIGAVIVAGLHRSRPRVVAAWLGVVAVPLAASELARLWYFAWPFPNTYYAKIAARGVSPLDWDGRGWSQLREWADRLWQGYWAPVYALGLTGLEPRRVRIALAVVTALAASLLWPGTADLRALGWWPALPQPPEAFVGLRLAAIAAAGVGLPLLALGTPSGPLRLQLGWTAAFGLAFGVASNGDWMGAYRWMSLVTPPLCVLLAVGLTAVADAADRAFAAAPTEAPTESSGWQAAGWVVVAVGTGLLLPPNLSQTRDHVYFNVNETTASVKQRVDHTRGVLRRTFWDGPVTNLEVDQGAHLWWAPDYAEVDMAMLVDVPMARHWYQQRAFVQEYVFDEREPTFAHVGGWWALHTGLRRYPSWDATYVELPPYEDLRFHAPFRNVFVRRELVFADDWPAIAPRRAAFDWGITLEDVVVPAPWSPGQPGYLEAPLSVATDDPDRAVTVTAFLAREGAVVASFDLPMGYGLVPMGEWAPGAVFRGRQAVPVPADLAPGWYDLGFALTGPRGYAIPALDPAPGPPVFARGEVRFARAVEVVDPATLAARTDAAIAGAIAVADGGGCDEAEAGWVAVKRHHPRAWAWHDAVRPPIAAAIARCWANRAATDPTHEVRWLANAHRWDPDAPALAAIGGPIADRLLAEGRAARASADWVTAYARFSAVLSFQPWRSWARRWAEEARDHRLGLTDDVRIGIGGENELRALEGDAPR